VKVLQELLHLEQVLMVLMVVLLVQVAVVYMVVAVVDLIIPTRKMVEMELLELSGVLEGHSHQLILVMYKT
jgi:hypothetical protein